MEESRSLGNKLGGRKLSQCHVTLSDDRRHDQRYNDVTPTLPKEIAI